MSEKQAIERVTAESFLEFYNSAYGTSYRIVELSDAPDVRCADSEDRQLNLEITMTEDRPQDIQAVLGRSDHRSIDELKAFLERVKSGQADPLERLSSSAGDAGTTLVARIRKKMTKRYGHNTALIVRDTSGVDWDWDLVVPDVRQVLAQTPNPFEMGIWIINQSRNRPFKAV